MHFRLFAQADQSLFCTITVAHTLYCCWGLNPDFLVDRYIKLTKSARADQIPQPDVVGYLILGLGKLRFHTCLLANKGFFWLLVICCYLPSKYKSMMEENLHHLSTFPKMPVWQQLCVSGTEH